MTTVDSWPKTLPMPSIGSWNSTTETHLMWILLRLGQVLFLFCKNWKLSGIYWNKNLLNKQTNIWNVSFRFIFNQLCRGSFYRDGKRSILGMLTPADFQGGQWGYEFQNEWSRCRRHTACRFTVVFRVIKNQFSKFQNFRQHT